MKYYVETSLENFEAWSGGRDTLEVLIDKGLCDTNENYPACQGCPYEKLRGLTDCEAAYYHDHPENDDGIRIFQ